MEKWSNGALPHASFYCPFPFLYFAFIIINHSIMQAIILPAKEYTELLQRVEEINSKLDAQSAAPEEKFIDNADFIELMKISKRTAQSWRDEGIISFSQIGSKIYYRMSDIQAMLDKNYRKSFLK